MDQVTSILGFVASMVIGLGGYLRFKKGDLFTKWWKISMLLLLPLTTFGIIFGLSYTDNLDIMIIVGIPPMSLVAAYSSALLNVWYSKKET